MFNISMVIISLGGILLFRVYENHILAFIYSVFCIYFWSVVKKILHRVKCFGIEIILVPLHVWITFIFQHNSGQQCIVFARRNGLLYNFYTTNIIGIFGYVLRTCKNVAISKNLISKFLGFSRSGCVGNGSGLGICCI